MWSDASGDSTRFVIASDPMAVRQALQQVSGRLAALRVGVDACENAQIVLTEVLNNIVEHAYVDTVGEIEVTIDRTDVDLHYRIVDRGLPLPGGAVPQPAVLVPIREGDLREGGYGWHLIRTLSHDLQYRREAERNILTFAIAVRDGKV